MSGSSWTCSWCGLQCEAGATHECTREMPVHPAAVELSFESDLHEARAERDRYIARCAELERRLEAIRKYCDGLKPK